MSEIDLQFGFERSAVRLVDGSLFFPMKQAAERWVVPLVSEYTAIAGRSFEMLYRLADQRFVIARYECCQPLYPDVEVRKNIWISEYPPRGQFVTASQAANWLLQYQFSIPDALQEVLLQPPPPRPEPRTLSYWVEQGVLISDPVQMAAEVNRIALAERVLHHADATVELLEEAKDDHIHFQERAYHLFGMVLFNRYKVTRETWWGDKTLPPPRTVGLAELPWAKHEAEVAATLRDICDLMQPPLACQAATMFAFSATTFLTEEERQIGYAALRATLPDLKALTFALGNALEGLEPPTEDEATGNNKTTIRKRATRAVNIERLEKELIEHIKSAKSYALDAQGRRGAPELLPRPTKTELAERCKLEPYDVTRCFQDETSERLKMLWRIANDLQAILTFSKRR